MEDAMRRALLGSLVLAAVAAQVLAAQSSSSAAMERNGRIAFSRFNSAIGDTTTFTVNARGGRLTPLYGAASATPRWSPDGTHVAILCCDDGMAAHIVNERTGRARALPEPDPRLDANCGFAWSPDGRRLACETFGHTDSALNGIYSIRVSDGRGVRRLTRNPGGDDLPGGYSPNGRRMVFLRSDANGPVGLFVTRLDRGAARQITPSRLIPSDETGGRWAPAGDRIVFAARSSADNRLAIWIVRANGRGLHRVPVSPHCGGSFDDPTSLGCLEPAWSPDGSRIAFTIIRDGGATSIIYTIRPDGSDLARVTTGGVDSQPDWGTRP
jgi:Tol biopolymer transport system component